MKHSGATGWIWSKYRRKLKGIGGRDGGGKNMKRRKTYGSVRSERGVIAKGCNIPEIKCQIPRTRREKYLLGEPKKK